MGDTGFRFDPLTPSGTISVGSLWERITGSLEFFAKFKGIGLSVLHKLTNFLR